MKKRSMRALAIMFGFLMLASLLAGCGSPGKGNAGTGSTTATQQKTETTTEAQKQVDLSFPLVDKPVTLTCFWAMDAKASMVIKSYSEMELFKEMAKRTGITIEFIHPPTEQETQQFNLMIATDDIPDLVHYNWSKYPGGMSKLIKDGVFMALNDYFDDYAPNLSKALKENEEWKRQITLDDGTLYMFPRIKKDTTILVTSGFQVRKDWLDRLKLEPPVTIDDWYNMLVAFKDQDANGNGDPNDEIPYGTFNDPDYGVNALGVFYGVYNGFYQDDGKIKYGPLEPEFKDYVTMLNKWYSEGLIDQDYLSSDRSNFESKAISNRVGAYFGMANGFMGKFQGIWEQDHPDYQLIPVPPAIAPDGKKYGLHVQAQVGNDGMAISTKNKYFKESITYFDYLYGEEGHMLAGYGIEGKSYTMVNGEPRFTDEILKNPEGIPAINALHKYNYSVGAGPCFQTEHIFSQMAQYPQVAATYKTWAEGITKMNLTNLSSTDEEGSQLAKIMGDINTYQDEKFHKFIMGQEPLSNYDAYVERIKSMNIDTAIKIYQNMLDRYLSK